MSKERLEEIKTSTWNICECETCYCENFKPQMIAVDPKHFEWLIEQAELRQEQIEKNQKALECLDVIERRYNALEKQNQRLRQALEFYADRDNYKLEHFDPNLDDYMSTVDYDEGKTARKALEGEE